MNSTVRCVPRYGTGREVSVQRPRVRVGLTSNACGVGDLPRFSAAVERAVELALWAVSRSRQNVESWAPNYRDLGRADLTGAELRRCHAAWTQHLLGAHR
jgi:hypothetical protein